MKMNIKNEFGNKHCLTVRLRDDKDGFPFNSQT